MPPVGFEPTISAGERTQTHALDRAATGTCSNYYILFLKGINNSVGKGPGIMETNYFRINKHLYVNDRVFEIETGKSNILYLTNVKVNYSNML